MKSIAASLLAVSLVVPALAQDGDPTKAPPAPAPAPTAPAGGDAGKPAAKAPEAKKERKTTPEAEAAIKRYADLLGFPPADTKSFHFVADMEIAQLGGTVTLDYLWERDKAPTVKVELPEATRDQIPEQYQDMIKKQMASQMGAQMTERLDAKLSKYNLAHKAEGGGVIVDITPFDEAKCEYETGRLVFNADGLLTKQTVTLHVDPNNPQAAMMAGAEIESTYTHAKKGDRYAVEKVKTSMPMGETEIAFAYYEMKDLPALPKQIEINSPMMPEPMTVAYHDWAIDGKPVAGTEAKKKTEAVKPADKPADGATDKPGDKPAEPPKDTPK